MQIESKCIEACVKKKSVAYVFAVTLQKPTVIASVELMKYDWINPKS